MPVKQPAPRPDPWWSLVGWTERLSGLPGRFSFPVVQAAQGALLGVIGLYWDAWRHAGGEEGRWSWPHLLIFWGLEAAVVSAALIHSALDGPRSSRERAAGSGSKLLNLVELAINAVLARLFAPGRSVRRGKEATMSSGGRVMLVAGTIGLLAFAFQVEIDNLLDAHGSVVDLPHVVVIAAAIAATIGAILLLRDALSMAVPTDLAKPWAGIAAGSLLVGLAAFWAPLDTYEAGQDETVRTVASIAAAAGVLSLARAWLGPGGALQAAAWFIAIRLTVAVVVGALPDGEMGRVELPLAEAAAVELAFALRWRPLAAGALAGLLGVPAALAWAQVSIGPPLDSSDVPIALLAAIPLAAIAASTGTRAAAALRLTTPQMTPAIRRA